MSIIFSGIAFSIDQKTVVTIVEGKVMCFNLPSELVPKIKHGELSTGVFIGRINEYSGKVELVSGRKITAYIPYNLRMCDKLRPGALVLLQIGSKKISGILYDIVAVGIEIIEGSEYIEGEIKKAGPDELSGLIQLANGLRKEINIEGKIYTIDVHGEVVDELLEEAIVISKAPPTTTTLNNPNPFITQPPTGEAGEVEEEFPEIIPAPAPTPSAFTITTDSTLPNGGEGTGYSQTLSASGGVEPYTWSLISGSLPSGLSLSSSGIISGTIASSGARGTYTFMVMVTDSVGNTATKQFTLTVVYTVPTFSTPENISQNDGNIDRYPRIHNGKVVWEGYDGTDWEIYYWDGSTKTNISQNDGNNDQSVYIHNGKATWWGWDGWDFEVYYWDGSTTTNLSNNGSPDLIPKIYNGKVAYSGWDGNDYEIYYWDGNTFTNISQNDGNWDRDLDIHNNHVVWWGYDGNDFEIYYWDGSTKINISNYDAHDDYFPEIHNDKVTWYAWDGNDREVFYWDGSTKTNISQNDGNNDQDPKIYNGKVVWEGYDGSDWEIYYWDGSTKTNITNNVYDDLNPHIYNNKVVWEGYDGNDYEIYYWDGTSTVRITDNSYDDHSPWIHEDKVVWYGYDGNDYEIYYAQRTAGSDPIITGRIYDSVTGETIDSPITSIYPKDSTTALTSTTDNPYSFAVSNGYYYFRVEKEGYTFPSNKLNGITSGDHGENFYGSGANMTIDIPIDQGYPLEITKTPNKRRVVNGDIITFDIKIRNNSMWDLYHINIIDEITNGFKYVKDSTYVDNSQLPETNISIANRKATFKITNVPGYAVTHLTYQVRVGTGISPGEYKTTAVAWDRVRDWRMSNESSCKVEVVYDALFTMGTIIGKVFYDKNTDGIQQKGENGISNVRIATEYGVVVETDRNGKYHIPAVPPGNHLLKADPSTLPTDSVFTTENPYFVKITEGLLAKVNFGVTQISTDEKTQINTDENKFFIVALGEGIVRNLDTSGNIEMVEQDDRFDEGINIDGKLALYLKGKIKGKYLVTLSIDTDRRPTRRGKAYEMRKLFTNLDPDKYYPVYGDASKISYEAADTQDELYLLIEWDESHIKWGSFNTDIPLYNRTMQGANIVYQSTKRTKFGDPYTKINAFYARAYQVAAHDEFLGTGGSLYYLRDTPIIEGSEKVRVELRDPVSKEIIAVTILTEEKDYEIDYETGRIILKKSLSSVNYGYSASIISNDILGGSRVYLVVDYEYESTSSIRREAYGIKASQWIGSHIRVGGTYIEEEKLERYYKLMGGDATVKINKDTEVTGEYNRSEETQLSSAYSIDGGLSYSTLNNTINDDKTGSSVSIKGKTRLFNNTDISLGYTRQDDNYSATDTISTQGSSIYTGSIFTRLRENILLGVRHISQEVKGTLLSADLIGNNKVHTTTAIFDYTPNRLDIRLEYQHQNTENPFIDFTYAGYGQLMDHDVIGARIGYKFTDRFHPYIGGQGAIQGQVNNQGYAGLEYQIWENTYLRIKETIGNLGNSTLLGLISQLAPGSEAYTNIEVGNNAQIGEEGKFIRTTTGQRTQIDKDSSINWERDYSSWQSNILQGELVGYETKLLDTLSFGASYERAQIEKEETAVSRDTGSITLSYLNIDTIKGFSKLELREDRGGETKRQWLTQNNLLWQLTQDISLLGRCNWSETYNRSQHATGAQFHELGLGLAYRPVEFDRLNLLAKYSYITNDMPESQNEFSQTQEDIRSIYAFEGAYDICRYLQLVGKFAMRDMSEKIGPRDWTDSETYLYITRLNFHATNKWDIAAEYRTLANRQIEDSKSGWLFEVDRGIVKYIRLGVGYNFTSYDDDLSNSDDYDASGWFIRVNGEY